MLIKLLFGKKFPSPMTVTQIGSIAINGILHTVSCIKCTNKGTGLYLFQDGNMVEREIEKPPLTIKTSGELKNNPVSILLPGEKPQELSIEGALAVLESIDTFQATPAFYSLKKELEPKAKKAPDKPDAKKANNPVPPAITVEAETVR